MKTYSLAVIPGFVRSAKGYAGIAAPSARADHPPGRS